MDVYSGLLRKSGLFSHENKYLYIFAKSGFADRLRENSGATLYTLAEMIAALE